MVYVHNGILVIKKMNNVICSNIALEIIILSEVSQTKTDIIWYWLYVESKKNDINELIYKAEIDL